MSNPSEVISLAKTQLGYHEKASNANLDSKTGNSGANNYTKYARDLYNAGYYNGNKNGFAWCDTFVDWLFYKLYGKTEGERIECQTGVLGAGTPYSAGYYKAQGRYDRNPKPGDQVFFRNAGGICHTGIVTEVTPTQVKTIEGNSNNQVMEHTYNRSDSYIDGYGHPRYSETETADTFEQKGVDVSYWNGNSIDWKRVKASGIDFATIRAGYGKNHIDSYFERNAKNAIAAGVNVGFYWFSYASTAEEARAEANNLCDAVELIGVKPTYPLCFDYEYDSEQKCPPKESIVSIAKAFLSRIKERGYYPANYANIDYLNRGFGELVGEYDLWLAHWNTTTPGRDCQMWQYTDQGKVDGISGIVDMNRCYKNYPAVIGGTGTDTNPVTPPADEAGDKKVMVEATQVQYGSKGGPVKSAQMLLNGWGYSCGSVDGDFGPKTEKATKKFQSARGIVSNGVIESQTWGQLLK